MIRLSKSLIFLLFVMGLACCAHAVSIDELGSIRITINGKNVSFEIGAAVSAIGDFNGDGLREAAIGSPSFEPGDFSNDYDTGAVFIISGAQLNRDRGEIDLGSDSFDGVVVMGRIESQIGQALDAAGDVNGDGLADLAIGSQSTKAAYILFGKSDPRRLVPITDLKNDGVEITNTGYAIAGGGDINGDGFADVVFGNPESSKISIEQNQKEYETSRVTILYGASQLPPVMDSRITTDHILSMRGMIAGARAGEYVCGNLDINADGYSDFLLVAPKGGKDLEGRAFLVLGKPSFDQFDPQFVIDHSTRFIRPAGDVNGDGFPDLLVGLDNQSTLLLWGGDNMQGALDLRNISTQWGPVLQGAPSTYGVGDVNGDGLADIAIGLPYDSIRDKAYAGQVVFIMGRSEWPSTVDVHSLCNGENSLLDYLVVEGIQPFGAFGFSIAGLGDIQNDGYADVIVGSPGQMLPGEPRLESPGMAYVIQGKSLFQCLQSRRSMFRTSLFLSKETQTGSDSIKK